MKVRCVRGPVFVDGAMMFSGQVKEVHEGVARKLVAEHPDSLALVEAPVPAGVVEEAPVVEVAGDEVDQVEDDHDARVTRRRGRRK